MTKLLLSVHVLAAILAIGPVAVAASMFPPAARAALSAPGDGQAAGTARVLYRICGVYSALGLVAVVFGFFTAQSLGVLGEGWLIAAIALTTLAALVLAFAVLPTQRGLIDEITAAGQPAEQPAGEPFRAAEPPAAGLLPAASTGAAALARSRRLAMSVGTFNLLWVAVTILMIVRPGSTTGA